MKPFLTQTAIGARALLLSLTALLSLLLHQPLFAGQNVNEAPEDIARRLQLNYDQIRSLSFHFTQSTEGELSGRPQQGSGTAWFVKEKKNQEPPGTVGKMRWDYTSPDKQVLVSDGVNFSMYFAKLEQMIISPADTMKTDITYAFFTGSGNLLKDFSISAPTNPELNPKEEDADHYKVIKLIPKENQSQVSEIHLWVTPDSLIQRMEILDHFDTRTTLEFSNLKTNTLPTDDPKAMDALFSYTPPEGTEIIYQ
ncbi:MAG: outer membrane lipoprotein carrier protein LolA [Proteobacteria bacterium]|nr:outer membrane lipoprotein carrier protein LolA [Pseudomonadota bacterium]MBU1649585.1 outer membrane lipoprotein carrier protein LolA [Pseudomonadota bacterium]MBU1986732.1 outer membrane lipoprotein carrier protein LolA [Pseudomonadota bacterium]